MKKRILSIIAMLLVAIPIIIVGGIPFKVLVILINIRALKEFISLKRNIPKFVYYIIYVFVIFSLLINDINYKCFMFLIFTLTILIIYYNDNKKFSSSDLFYMFSGTILIMIPCSYAVTLRNNSLNLLTYLILVTTMTDTFAYLIGKNIGKHKLIEKISPKKTIEGLIGGTVCSVLISSIFYMLIIGNINILYLIFKTAILSITAQFGDLFFSSIKREYNVKDFSNLIPGHGGLLDRIDSLLFVILVYMLFI